MFSSSRLALRLTPTAVRVIRQGHPWLFESGIQHQSHTGQAGDLAVLFDQKRRFVAIGLYDPTSPIRVRVLHHGPPTTIDEAWLATQIQAALGRRAPLLATATTGLRLIYGEGDGLPGLVADQYDQTVVLKLYTAAWLPHLPTLLPLLPGQRLILRLSRHVQTAAEGWHDGQTVRGTPPTAPVPFTENGLHFAADVVHGHKTGFFFDQRENRQQVRQWANGRRVLDLFAYAGGFSLYAAAGGATAVTSVDISAPALAEAQANFERNRHLPTLAHCTHTPIAGDVFATLAQLQAQKQRFEMVIVDPPAFAKNQAEVAGALAAYDKLTRAVLPVLAPQGLLVMASCSSRVSAEAFFATVHASAEACGRPLWEQRRTSHPLDHPLRPEFPEGAYLKCLYATTIEA